MEKKYFIFLFLILLFFINFNCKNIINKESETIANEKYGYTTRSNNEIRSSDISLMPEGMPQDIKEFKTLNPGIVAWGGDPIFYINNMETYKKEIRGFKELGVKMIACNVWMLTATEEYLYHNPEYREAVCRDITGTPIVPPWLDGDYKGVKPYWGCTNNPLFQELLIMRAKLGIKNGATMLHLDDHLCTFSCTEFAGGCFCDYCMEGFRKWLAKEYNAKELKERGIHNIEQFNYAEFIKSSGYATKKAYKEAFLQYKIPLKQEFLRFQKQASLDFIKRLKAEAEKITGSKVLVGVNSYTLFPMHLPDSHLVDYFANEVEHYNKEDLIPPMVYKLATSLNKPLFATGNGEDWVHVKQKNDETRVRRWIATAYAFGHYFMYAYKKWCFSQETGTLWYQTPIKTYKPICDFITENRELFDDYEPVSQIGVLYSNAACLHDHWQVREVCRDLHYANIPFKLIPAHDEYLQVPLLNEDNMKNIELLIIPEPTLLTGKQDSLIKKWIKQGKAVSWSNIKQVKSIIDSYIKIQNSSMVWALPREIPEKPNSPLIIHLLNQDYDSQKDKMRIQKNLKISLSMSFLKNKKSSKATLYAPEKKPITLPVKIINDRYEIIVPELNIWGILKIE